MAEAEDIEHLRESSPPNLHEEGQAAPPGTSRRLARSMQSRGMVSSSFSGRAACKPFVDLGIEIDPAACSDSRAGRDGRAAMPPRCAGLNLKAIYDKASTGRCKLVPHIGYVPGR